MIQIDAAESRWGGFLIDKDAESVISLIGGIRATAHDDPDIVEEAWWGGRTIVTSNGADFIRYIGAFQRRENNRECRDLWGLLIIPNKALVRERLVPRLYREGLSTPEGRLKWAAIGYLNICLTLESDGTVLTRRFGRCSHCNRDAPVDSNWYRALPVVGAKGQA